MDESIDKKRRNRAEYMRRWRAMKGEELLVKQREYNRRYYYAHLEERQERNRKNALRYHYADPVRARASKAARQRGAPFSDEAQEYAQLILGDPCSYCGNGGGEIDHIVPLRAGGDSDRENLASACAWCNRSKGPKSLLAFMFYSLSE